MRSILAAADPELGQGTLGTFVRTTSAELSAASTAVATADLPVALRATARCLIVIASLAVRAFPDFSDPLGADDIDCDPDRDRSPVFDVLDVLAEDVMDRYRLLPPAVDESLLPEGERPPGLRAAQVCLAQHVPVDLYLRQLAGTVGATDPAIAVGVLQAAIAWVAIDGRIGEAAGWLLLDAPGPARRAEPTLTPERARPPGPARTPGPAPMLGAEPPVGVR